MKTAKSCKIFILIIAFMLALVCSITLFNTSVTKAEEISATNYVSGSFQNISFDDDKLIVNVKNNDSFTFSNNLVVDDFAMEIASLDDNIESFDFYFNSQAYIVTGNKNAEGKFDTLIKNNLHVEKDGNTLLLTLNDNATDTLAVSGSGNVTIKIEIVDNLPKFTVLEGSASVCLTEDRSYYKVKNVDGTLASGIGFKFNVQESATADFKIVSIDQNVSDENHNYKQTFVKNGDTFDFAYPRITLDSSLFVKNFEGQYTLKAYQGKVYSLTPFAYAVFGSKSYSKIEVKQDDRPNGLTEREFASWTLGTVDFSLGEDDKVYASYSVDVITKDIDEVAPMYIDDAEALESFENALRKKYLVNDGEHSVVLGNDMLLPSFESLVVDDITPYSALTSTVYYYGPSTATTGTNSSLKINLGAAGDYTFFVVFKDANGNEMDKTAFINKEGTEFTDSNLIFSFHVDDDAPISVKAPNPSSIGNGNVGSKYSAVNFTIDASGFNTDYTLFYNADKNATVDSTGWVEIPKASSVTDKAYDKDGYNYDAVKAIAFDGTKTFTPDKEGAYKLTCRVSSKVSYRAEEASQIIVVNAKKTEVNDPEPLSTNNIWAIVFLSIGTLCLIGIVILIFVKPKKENEDISTDKN